jgi:hypothetical protein
MLCPVHEKRDRTGQRPPEFVPLADPPSRESPIFQTKKGRPSETPTPFTGFQDRCISRSANPPDPPTATSRDPTRSSGTEADRRRGEHPSLLPAPDEEVPSSYASERPNRAALECSKITSTAVAYNGAPDALKTRAPPAPDRMRYDHKGRRVAGAAAGGEPRSFGPQVPVRAHRPCVQHV